MTFASTANNYAVAFGTASNNIAVPVYQTRSPTSSDIRYVIGKRWINTAANIEYVLTSFANTNPPTANWQATVSAGSLSTLTGDSGGAISPSAGNITLAGTSDQITTTGSGSTITFSLVGPYTPTTYTAHGVLIGEGTSSIAAVSPDATSGIALISQGSSSDPAYGTVVVGGGGTGATTLTAHGVLLGEGTSAVVATTAGTNGQVLLGSTGADPAFGTLTTSTGITFTTGANSLAINTTGGGLKANAESGAGPFTGATQNSYIFSEAAQTTVSLPTTSAVGDHFIVAGTNANSGGWVISQATGQQIFNTTNHSTSGATGSISTGAANTSATLMCTAANTTWIVLASTGTVTYT